ncbi:phospho-N-acetylmuramoyl-pentapeptide-transferase, partial [Helicobacter pylori]
FCFCNHCCECVVCVFE